MTPTRSATARRKRDSTMQAVDFLNSVMDTNGPVTENHQSHSENARYSRRSRKNQGDRIPHSDSIWELPRSPQQRQQHHPKTSPHSDTLTPRRSSRLRMPQEKVQSTPTRRSRRLMRAESAELRGFEEDQPDNPPLPSNAKDQTFLENDENSSDREIQEDELVNVNFFSDDIPDPATSQAPESPPPTGASGQNWMLEDLYQVATSSPPGRTSSQSSSAEGRSSPLLGDLDGFLRDDINPNQHSHLPETEVRETPDPSLYSASDIDDSNPDDMDLDINGLVAKETNLNEDDEYVENSGDESSGSVYETVAEPSSSDSDLFVPQDDTTSTAASLRKRQVSRIGAPEERRSPFVTHPRSDTRGSSRLRSSHNSDFLSSSASHNTPQLEGPALSSRLREAMFLGQQEGNWEVLINEARRLGQNANPSMRSHFQDMTSLIVHLHGIYEKLRDGLDVYKIPSLQYIQRCENILKSISREGEELLDNVYYIGIHRKETFRRKSQRLLGEFEARIIPELVDLILVCFETYYTGPDRFPEAYDHLHDMMALLLRLCDRMASLTAERYVPGTTRTHRLRAALKKLVDASNSQKLRMRDSEPSKKGTPVPPKNGPELLVPETKPWTDEEVHALLTGLQNYQDADRYLWILNDFNKQLGERTIRELRVQAQETHDRFVPMIRDELETREGRQKWHWLLSIRG